jgi:hypothetical protein
MPALVNQLDIERCPHCQVDKPLLTAKGSLETVATVGGEKRIWKWYVCSRCGCMVTACASQDGSAVQQIFPRPAEIDGAVPSPAKEYLTQALQSLHAPAGAVMLAASAVDAMLKEKGYKEGTLNSRIKKSAEDHLITDDMAQWAHEVRLDANDPRHADETNPLPSTADGRRSIDFAQALAQFLFVLPARVRRGREEASKKRESA